MTLRTQILISLATAVAAIGSLVLWEWGISVHLKTEQIAASEEFSINQGAPADQISFLPDGNFMTVRNNDGVFLWQVQGANLIRRRIFSFVEMAEFIELRKRPLTVNSSTSTQPESPFPPRLTVEPAIFSDASKAVVYHQNDLAVFPHDWNGHDDEVQVAWAFSLRDNIVATALAVTESGFVAVAYQDNLIQFRKANYISDVHSSGSASSGYSSYVDKPSAMKVYGELLHVISNANAKITVLNLKSTSTITREREVSFPTTRASDFRLAVSDKGRIAVANHTKDVFVTASDATGDAYTPWPVYGPVKAVSFLDNEHLAVGGDFQHIYLLEEGKIPFHIANAERGVSALALSSNRLVYSGDRLVLMSYKTSKELNRIGWVVLTLAFIAVGTLGATITDWVRYRKPSEEPSEPPVTPSADSKIETLPHPIPDVPSALVKAMRAGQCVLYCGSGVSAQAGFPYWKPFVESLTAWAISNAFVDPAFGASLRAGPI